MRFVYRKMNISFTYEEHHMSNLAHRPSPCSSLAVQNSRRRPEFIHHVIRAAAYVMTILLRINDVIGCATLVFYVERGAQRSQ